MHIQKEESSASSENNGTSNSTSKRRSVAKFLHRTYQMLQEAKFTDYVAWSPEGDSLVIKRPYDFAENVLPMFFKHNNFQSFIRQLNKYNFKKEKKAGYDLTYSHPYFHQHKPELMSKIQRKKGCKNASREECQQEQSNFPQASEAKYEEIAKENAELHTLKRNLAVKLEESKSQLFCLNKENEVIQKECEKQEQAIELLKNMINELTAGYPNDGIFMRQQQSTMNTDANYGRMPYKKVFSAADLSVPRNNIEWNTINKPVSQEYVHMNWNAFPRDDLSLARPASMQLTGFRESLQNNANLNLNGFQNRPLTVQAKPATVNESSLKTC